MNITGAIFDMDGTLADSLGFWSELWQGLGEKYLGDKSFTPDDKTEKAIRTLPLKDAMELLHNTYGLGESADEVLQTANAVWARVYEDKVELKAGVKDFLEHCRKKGIKMCIASATAPFLLDILMKRFGLYIYFPKIFSCSEVGKGKEHPDVFIKAHEYLGTDKESTWIFEDSIAALETAAKAGYKTVGIYDECNFNLDKVKEISDEYIGEGDSLARLIDKI